MNIDFSLLLVLLILFCGIVWALGAMLNKNEAWPTEYAKSFFPLLLLVLVLRSFIFEPFKIPTGSMKPTLLIGDFILVNKFAYGLRMPVLNTKFLDLGDPERGDIAVFRYPDNPKVNYIKRIVGVPGDHITYRGKVLTVNGQVATQVDIGEYDDEDAVWDSQIRVKDHKKEMLGDIEHSILVQRHPPRHNIDLQVPEGMYFALGDNRDNSKDSRSWGFVPEDNLVGKAFLVWMNFYWKKGGFSWSRIGDTVK